ncbi:putative TRK system potassium uptake transmembrane protein [Pseudorhizobium banfieldiae]|uniref:Trk system potassium uptake protein n=1 Tax=Pseudorhizobium banfieldiae TaxID=1125847 RepID=L0NG39_9HYPH|nr:TrkH family potassium uptake protein [Pseudorhizobium banfieldiae]CAD6606624.1 metal ABC transporter ATPase [arsenite-oxidising bacterium NT-25]CAD6614304.1 metal ABC transporter ATPase [Rhizobium sp. TCK]CCF19257.1 putative TRK system potassium uptake transmembrane protein [Pseudorhizobium banfieldiae]
MNASLLRPAIYIAALCGLYLATAMFVPAMIDLYYGHEDWQVFALSGFMVGGISLMTALATRGASPVFTKRLGFLLVNLLWAVFSLVGAIPLYLADHELSFAQSLFESISAITTTGSTVLSGLDTMPPGILLWRSLLQWLGGIGIVALGLFVLPFLRVGGMSFFKLESSDTSDKPFARLASFTRAFMAVYVGITLACAIAYGWAGMTGFDALNHALTTVATGGFSTHDASFGYFDSIPLLWISSLFMTICSLPFSLLIIFVVRRRLNTLRDPQIVVFVGYLVTFAVALAVYHHLRNGTGLGTALAHSFHNISSILSTTGYASDDYTNWGPFAVALAFFATFMGGCTGSTAGGIKAYRFVVLFNIVGTGLKRLVYPNAVYSVRYGSSIIEPEAQRGIFLFIALYIFLWAVGSLAMALLGYDFLTSASAVLTALSNVGPGIGSIVGPAGNFSTISDPALYLLSLLMLLGRLEILTVLVLLTPVFWRQ